MIMQYQLFLKDKYFEHLFKLAPGVYGNMYHDLKERIKLQSTGKIPKSVFSLSDNRSS